VSNYKASVGTPTAYNERKKYRKAFKKQYFGRKAQYALSPLEASTFDKTTMTAAEMLRAQSNYKDCLAHHFFSIFGVNILHGVIEVTDDPAVKQAQLATGADGVTLLPLELWQAIFHGSARFQENSSEKERKTLNDREIGRLEGAIIALDLALGQHHDATIETLISDDLVPAG
jgi:hypothetical protein